MSDALPNAIRLQAERVGSRTAKPVAGVVTSYDPGHYCAKVQLQPTGEITGWLPVSTLWIGNGWGLYCPPSIGDTVNVYFLEGDHDSGQIEGRQFGGVNNPLSVPSGELWIVHMSGSFFKFLNDGTIASKGVWNHDGPLNTTGTITSMLDIIDHVTTKNQSMAQQRAIYDSHTHPVGGGNTGTPNEQE